MAAPRWCSSSSRARRSRNRSPGVRLPLDDALTIARQIADALEAAHERGIVHRDLKPANIEITPAGVVKVLDFGLAKLGVREIGGPGPKLADSPTMIGGTREGVIVGSAAYMSPEQARGAAVDKRTDIWAFGCVLYEMLTGGRAFGGDALSDTLAAVLKDEPDLNRVPAPARVLVQRCLQKDPKRRLRDIGDAMPLLETVPHVGVAPRVDRRSIVDLRRLLRPSALLVRSGSQWCTSGSSRRRSDRCSFKSRHPRLDGSGASSPCHRTAA